ncbi:hypothetical protein HMPREF9601_01711 [Cutibacterium acnes HL030PA1]|nr:hypothetical protein HMPREF9601_01711 [Cutibacterium acnes HL030PA1]
MVDPDSEGLRKRDDESPLESLECRIGQLARQHHREKRHRPRASQKHWEPAIFSRFRYARVS